MTTQLKTRAFPVVDDDGHRDVIVRTEPVRDEGSARGTVVELGVEMRLRNGDSVMAISETEFESADGKHWRLAEGQRLHED